MTSWLLELRQQPTCDIDASVMSPMTFASISDADEIKRLPLQCGDDTCPIGELFSISKLSSKNELRLVGDLSRFHRLGMQLRSGRITIKGNVGDYAGTMMSGGEIWIAGAAGNFLAAPVDSFRSGMSGGRIVVRDSAGNHVGHRMRRGEIFIEGSAGDFVGSHQIAGTIVVAAKTGRSAAYAMRRGTLVVNQPPPLSRTRFSDPIEAFSVISPLLGRQTKAWASANAPSQFACKNVIQLLDQIADEGFRSMRGDFAVGGQGEILFPR
ncbi:Formylmethanofuran dehydrogenase subunit C domain protein [Rhodopirellula maiorica SM1]|uniref:Formylmethanofuran dehydrogenase subunit C domain protein n=1 Tax=Rhodopirellula maiorica SM1 TaxID=1265738 RepID=M5RTE6_9BACT|nr:formylmethanofuran dehydrogenase subunit C [Rhodopirellula maiorica]EMI17234.1 Formylmethanofuran dehydrogenase subunit C domain protein [Rhodopirellula maiorica SM1]